LPKATIALVTRYSLLITLSVVASVDKQKKKIFSKIASIRTSPIEREWYKIMPKRQRVIDSDFLKS